MPKKFYTERDIEDLAAQGQDTLRLNDDVVLTALAYEKAESLGVKLLQPDEAPPSPSTRPSPLGINQTGSTSRPTGQPEPSQDDALRERIHRAVKANLGDQVDPELLDRIITRVLNNVRIG